MKAVTHFGSDFRRVNAALGLMMRSMMFCRFSFGCFKRLTSKVFNNFIPFRIGSDLRRVRGDFLRPGLIRFTALTKDLLANGVRTFSFPRKAESVDSRYLLTPFFREIANCVVNVSHAAYSKRHFKMFSTKQFLYVCITCPPL